MIRPLGVRVGAGAARARTTTSALACGLTAALALLLGALLTLAPPASAAPATGTGPEGQTLTVSQIDGLGADGTVVTVSGAGYNPLKGIYVAFCVTPPPGELPTPCGGGAATSGSGGLSGWISSNPPSYGKDLVTPFGDGGTFSMAMTLSPMIGAVDCQVASCAVVTRADHTRTDDRTADVIVPVTFGGVAAAPPATETTAAAPPTAAAPTTPAAAPATAAPAPTASSAIPPLITTLAGSAGEDSDSGSSAAPIAVGGGIAAVLAIGGIGYLAMRRRSGGRV